MRLKTTTIAAQITCGLFFALAQSATAQGPPPLPGSGPPPLPVTQWYASQKSGRIGPVGESVIAAKIRSGDITSGTQVWTTGMGNWQAANKVPQLGKYFPPRPPAPIPSRPPLQWYANPNGGRIGPVDEAVIAAKIRSGDITSGTQVWNKGLGSWKAAGGVPQLGAYFRTPPPPAGNRPVSAKLRLQAGIQPGSGGVNRMSRRDGGSMNISAIYVDVTFADGTTAGPHDYKREFAKNLIFDDTSGDPNDLIEVIYWDLDHKNPALGKYAAQLRATGKGTGTATLKVSFRNAPGLTASVQAVVVR